jgi:copper chaperone
MEHIFQVSGMTCGHCERAVREALQQIDPQADIDISRDTGKVSVRNTQTHPADLAQAIEDEGFSVA